jgi:hypothetical protein
MEARWGLDSRNGGPKSRKIDRNKLICYKRDKILRKIITLGHHLVHAQFVPFSFK